MFAEIKSGGDPWPRCAPPSPPGGAVEEPGLRAHGGGLRASSLHLTHHATTGNPRFTCFFRAETKVFLTHRTVVIVL